MSQEESELKEFLFVTNKLKQKAFITKFLSLGLVAISGLMVASSLGYMIYQVGNQRTNLEDCNNSKTALVNAVLNSNISESQKKKILGIKDNEQFPSNNNPTSGGSGITSLQNENSSISPSSSKPTPTDKPKASVTPTSESSPSITVIDSPTPVSPAIPKQPATKGESAKPKPSNTIEETAKSKGVKEGPSLIRTKIANRFG
jgi:hypothetical protein